MVADSTDLGQVRGLQFQRLPYFDCMALDELVLVEVVLRGSGDQGAISGAPPK